MVDGCMSRRFLRALPFALFAFPAAACGAKFEAKADPTDAGVSSDAADAMPPDGPDDGALQRPDVVDAPSESSPCAQRCNGACTDTQHDAANCGICGVACAQGYACDRGVCGNAVVQLSTYSETVCALVAAGDVYCWGINTSGQVGDGTKQARSTPTLVAKDTTGARFGDVAEVAVGAAHVCARKRDGSLWCWGNDDVGQLGDGNTFASGDASAGAFDQTRPSKVPVAIAAPGPLRAGLAHTCVVSGRGVWCWGGNAFGELGHPVGTMGDVPAQAPALGLTANANATPRAVAQLSVDVVDLGAGHALACAIASDATARCWGTNAEGELGVPGPSTFVPQQVLAPGGVTAVGSVKQIAGGTSIACALDTNGAVICWGANLDGAMGNGLVATDGNPAPTSRALVPSALQIGVGPQHGACAVTTAGNVHCWGLNVEDQLGHPHASDPTCTSGSPCAATPVIVATAPNGPALANVKAVAMSATSAYALKADGSVWSWGSNAAGQLGVGGGPGSAYPMRVVGLP